MNVSLTPELESWVQKKVNSGLYQSASEVIRESIRIFRERDDLHIQMTEDLRSEILLGLDDINQDRSEVFSSKTTEEIKSQGRKIILGDLVQ